MLDFLFDRMFVGIWGVLVVEYSAQIVIYIEKTLLIVLLNGFQESLIGSVT